MRIHALLPLATLSLLAQAPLPLAAPIRSVRLHPDEAWVTRAGTARVTEGGACLFLIRDLPSGLSLEDVRVAVKGPQGTRLGDLGLGTEVRKVTETFEYRALDKEREDLRDRLDALDAEGEALVQEQAFLKNLQASYDKELSARLPMALPGAAAVVDLSRGLEARLAENLTRDRKRRHEQEKLEASASRLDAELEKRASARNVSPGWARVELTVPRAGEVTVELTYRTRQARWEPAYEARLAADGKKVELVLFAAVRQSSGEDWHGVQVEVTNTRSSRSLALQAYAGPQEVTYSEQALPAIRGGKSLTTSYTVERVGVAGSNSQSNLAPGVAQNTYLAEAAPMEAQAVEEAGGLAATWSMEGAKEVPSDNEPHRFRVLSRELEPALALMAVPRLDPTVYRLARFPVPAGIPLFPGAPVVHFAGTQRVGLAPLAMPAPGKPMQLGFGPFRGVRVALQRLDAKKETVGAFSKETQWTLRERFEVANDTEEPVAVELQDRELRSANALVKILALPGTTPSQEASTPGVRAWAVQLGAKATGEVLQVTQIRTPVDGVVTGLGALRLP